MSRRAKVLALVIAPILVVGSLYLRTLVRRIFFAPSPPPEQAVRTQLSQAALQPVNAASQAVTLYFPSFSDGKLHAEVRSMGLASSDTDRIRQILLALIQGPTQGQRRSLPPSADVRAVFLTSDGTAYVDFSSVTIADFEPGIESETLDVYSIVDSLAANLPQVKRVKILVQGQEVDTLDGHADLTSTFVPDSSWIVTAAP